MMLWLPIRNKVTKAIWKIAYELKKLCNSYKQGVWPKPLVRARVGTNFMPFRLHHMWLLSLQCPVSFLNMAILSKLWCVIALFSSDSYSFKFVPILRIFTFISLLKQLEYSFVFFLQDISEPSYIQGCFKPAPLPHAGFLLGMLYNK